MECYCYLRNVQNLLGDGKTTHERRFGEPLKRPTIPFGVLIKYHPISPEDQSRTHHFGKKVFPEDVFLIAELEDLENWMHQTFYPQKIEAKEKLIRHKRMMNSYSHLQMAQQNCQEETTNSERLNQPQGAKNSAENFMMDRVSLSRQEPQMTLKPVPTSGRSRVTSSFVITMNLEFNSACRRKKHSLFH